MARSRIGGSSAPIHAQPATVAEAGASLNNRPTRITRSQSREPAPTNVGPAFNQRATHGTSCLFYLTNLQKTQHRWCYREELGSIFGEHALPRVT